MFKKIIWATDGSEAADRALAQAKMLAQDAGARLTVLHCEELTIPTKAGSSMPRFANEDELKEKIERQVAELNSDGVSATLQLANSTIGGAAHAIVDVAEREGADVIVIGTRGHTALAGLLVGSVAHRLLHIARCPILTVPAG